MGGDGLVGRLLWTQFHVNSGNSIKLLFTFVVKTHRTI